MHWNRPIHGCLIAALLTALPLAAGSQSYPTRPVRVISNAASGSPGDVALRLVAVKAGAGLGQPMIVETRGGGGGFIAAAEVLRAGSDGYALLYSSSMIMTSKYLLKNVTLDFSKEFAPLSLAARTTNLIGVHVSVPANTIREFVEYSKNNPGKVTVSSNGIGSSLHTQWIGFMLSTGADLFHIPYGSANEALRNNDFLTGRLSAALIPYSSMKPQMDAGKVRALAVMGNARYRKLPEVPAVTEAYPDYRLSTGFWGFFAPAGMPQAALARVAGEIQKGFRDPEVIAKLDNIDVEAIGSSPQEYAAFLKAYEATVVAIVKAAGLKSQ